MDGSQEYQNAVEDMQLWELMLESQDFTEQRELTHCPPSRAKSEPYINALKDTLSSATLKSLPVGDTEREMFFENHNLIKKGKTEKNEVKNPGFESQTADVDHIPRDQNFGVDLDEREFANDEEKNSDADLKLIDSDSLIVYKEIPYEDQSSNVSNSHSVVGNTNSKASPKINEILKEDETQNHGSQNQEFLNNKKIASEKAMLKANARQPMKVNRNNFENVENIAELNKSSPASENKLMDDNLMEQVDFFMTKGFGRNQNKENKIPSANVPSVNSFANYENSPIKQQRTRELTNEDGRGNFVGVDAQARSVNQTQESYSRNDSQMWVTSNYQFNGASNDLVTDSHRKKMPSHSDIGAQSKNDQIQCRSPPENQPAKKESETLVGSQGKQKDLPPTPAQKEERPPVVPRRKAESPPKVEAPKPAPRKKKSGDVSTHIAQAALHGNVENPTKEFSMQRLLSGEIDLMLSKDTGDILFGPPTPKSAWEHPSPSLACPSATGYDEASNLYSNIQLPASRPDIDGNINPQRNQSHSMRSDPGLNSNQGHTPPDADSPYMNVEPNFSGKRVMQASYPTSQMPHRPVGGPPRSVNYENCTPDFPKHPGTSNVEYSPKKPAGTLGFSAPPRDNLSSISASSQNIFSVDPVSACSSPSSNLHQAKVHNTSPFPDSSAKNSPVIFLPLSGSHSDLSLSPEGPGNSDLPYLTNRLKFLCSCFVPDEKKADLLKMILEKSTSLNDKYEVLNFAEIMAKNQEHSYQLHMPLRLLKKYAVNLLKPPDERPTSWRSIQFYSKLIQEKVGFLNGSKQILMQLGYTENMLNQHQQVVGLKFPDSVQEPNRERVLQLANDLTIAAFEIVEIANESHPKLEMLFRTGQVPACYRIPDDSDEEDFFDAQEHLDGYPASLAKPPDTKQSKSLPDYSVFNSSNMRNFEQQNRENQSSGSNHPESLHEQANSRPNIEPNIRERPLPTSAELGMLSNQIRQLQSDKRTNPSFDSYNQEMMREEAPFWAVNSAAQRPVSEKSNPSPSKSTWSVNSPISTINENSILFKQTPSQSRIAPAQRLRAESAPQQPVNDNLRNVPLKTTWVCSSPIATTNFNSTNPFDVAFSTQASQGMSGSNKPLPTTTPRRASEQAPTLPSIYNMFPPSPPPYSKEIKGVDNLPETQHKIGLQDPKQDTPVEKPNREPVYMELMPHDGEEDDISAAGICWSCETKLSPNKLECPSCGTERDDIFMDPESGQMVQKRPEEHSSLSPDLNEEFAFSSVNCQSETVEPMIRTGGTTNWIADPVKLTSDPTFSAQMTSAESVYENPRPKLPEAESGFSNPRPQLPKAGSHNNKNNPESIRNKVSITNGRPMLPTAESHVPNIGPMNQQREPSYSNPQLQMAESFYRKMEPSYQNNRPPSQASKRTEPSNQNFRPTFPMPGSYYPHEKLVSPGTERSYFSAQSLPDMIDRNQDIHSNTGSRVQGQKFPSAETNNANSQPGLSIADLTYGNQKPVYPRPETLFQTPSSQLQRPQSSFPRPDMSYQSPASSLERHESSFINHNPSFSTPNNVMSIPKQPSGNQDVSQYAIPSFYQDQRVVENSKAREKSADYWSCKHCTFHNPLNTKVCQMCWKTSFVSTEKPDPNFEVIVAEYPNRLPETSPMPYRDPVFFSPTNTSGRPAQQTLVQDPPSWNGSINSHIRQTPSFHNSGRPRNNSGDIGPHSFEVSGRVNGYPSYNYSDRTGQEPYRTGQEPYRTGQEPYRAGQEPYRTGKEPYRTGQEPYRTGQEPYRTGQEPYREVQAPRYDRRQQMRMQPQSNQRTMSKYELGKQQELAEQVKREKQHQDNLKKDAIELIQVIKKAEGRGFSVEEVQLATDFPKMQTRNILDWLFEVWPDIQSEAIKVFAEEKMGVLSTDEARDALIACGGDIQKAVRLCAQERQAKIDLLLKNENGFKKEDVVQALSTCKGNSKKALLELERKALQEIHDRIWKDLPEDIQRFHTKLQNQDIDRDVRTRLVLAHFSMKSWGKAATAIKLMEMEENKDLVEDCVEAASSNVGLDRAKRYMNHECKNCYCRFAMCKIFTHISCQCEICHGCMQEHITVAVMERNIRELTCPVCQKPDFKEVDPMQHFQHVGHEIKLLISKGELKENIQEIFEDKLRDFSLKNDPNFRWCAHCPEYGFVWEDPNVNKMLCRQCNLHTCFNCKLKWEDQHEGISCQEFRDWKIANDPENQMHGLDAHLAKNGITCPKCKTRFDLAQGGCIHFNCSECKYQFCGECFEEFLPDKACKDHPHAGLHAHHPRNCLYYQRDRSVEELHQLLNSHQIPFDTDPPEDQADEKCWLVEQKEEGERKYDQACGRETSEGNAGLCKKHYKEYLTKIINRHRLDPVEILDVTQVKIICQRHYIDVPQKEQEESEADYLGRLRQVVKDKSPIPFLGHNGNEFAPPQVQPAQAVQQENA